MVLDSKYHKSCSEIEFIATFNNTDLSKSIHKTFPLDEAIGKDISCKFIPYMDDYPSDFQYWLAQFKDEPAFSFSDLAQFAYYRLEFEFRTIDPSVPISI